MASYLAQAGTTLNRLSLTGVASAISLPTNYSLFGSSQPCRAVVFGSGQYPLILVVNGATHDFFIDSTGTARPLQLAAPVAALTAAAGAGTGLTGVYAAAVSFKVKDSNGATILESGLGPISAGSASLTNKSLLVSAIPVSSDGNVNARGLYRTLSGGNVLYPWFDIDDNTTLSADRGVVDASLSLLPTTATRNGAPPDLKLICIWKERAWGVPRGKIDYVRWTEERVFYAWPADNELVVPPQQTDTLGVSAFIPRRDQLGITRFNKVYQVTGDSNDTFQRRCISETLGCVSDESVVIERDIAYWLGARGIVEWSNTSIGYCSEAQVDAWFTTDTYFNRSLFSSCKGRYNPDTDAVEFLLASAGSSVLDSWIAFDLKGRRWFGVHKTDAFVPTCVGQNSERRGLLNVSTTSPLTVFGGSDGYLYKRDSSTADDFLTAVSMNADLPFLGGFAPEYQKIWHQPSIHTRPETTGALTLTPIVGELADAAQAPMTHDLKLERERLPRLGMGRYAQLNLQHSGLGESVRIYGIELPYDLTGRR